MADPEHLSRLKQGVAAWNQWRDEHPEIRPDLCGASLTRAHLSGAHLSEADLREADLSGADLRKAYLHEARLGQANLTRANLTKAILSGAHLWKVDLSRADLREAYLDGAHLSGADLRGAHLDGAHLDGAHLFEADLSGADLFKVDLFRADLCRANLREANLREANLTGADLAEANLFRANLSGANLRRALLVQTNLKEADLTGCSVYGVSAWAVNLVRARQSDLIITPVGDSVITVDNLEVAQFIYLLLHNEKLREVIDTIGQKGVLILGRFADERKAVLDTLRTALRSRGFLPMVFDFERPTQRDFTETIMTLAGMSLFVIADITNPRSTPLELQATVPDYMIPFVPIIAEGEEPFAMFIDLQRQFDWVLDVLTYDSIDHLLAGLQDAVITPALQKHAALVERRARVVGTRHIHQYFPDGEARP